MLCRVNRPTVFMTEFNSIYTLIIGAYCLPLSQEEQKNPSPKFIRRECTRPTFFDSKLFSNYKFFIDSKNVWTKLFFFDAKFLGPKIVFRQNNFSGKKMLFFLLVKSGLLLKDESFLRPIKTPPLGYEVVVEINLLINSVNVALISLSNYEVLKLSG